VENDPAAFAANDSSRTYDKKGGKKHVVRTAKESFIGDNVMNGTKRTKNILKTTIWVKR
jgi:hypothetical protein